MIFEKISKYFTFDQPYYLLPAQPTISGSLRFDDLRDKAEGDEISPMGTPSKMGFDTSCVETDAKMFEGGLTSSSHTDQISAWASPSLRADVKCSEIDQTTDGIEEQSIATLNQVHEPALGPKLEEVKHVASESQSVLYEPDINLIVQSINHAQDVIMAENLLSSS